MRSTWSRFCADPFGPDGFELGGGRGRHRLTIRRRAGPGFRGAIWPRLGEPVEVGAGVDVRVRAIEWHVPDELRMRPEHRAEAVIPGQLVGEAPDLAAGEDRVRGRVRGVAGDDERRIVCALPPRRRRAPGSRRGGHAAGRPAGSPQRRRRVLVERPEPEPDRAREPLLGVSFTTRRRRREIDAVEVAGRRDDDDDRIEAGGLAASITWRTSGRPSSAAPSLSPPNRDPAPAASTTPPTRTT